MIVKKRLSALVDRCEYNFNTKQINNDGTSRKQ
jgi:hypothetical protein